MHTRFQSRAWSTSTLLRGIGLMAGQHMDLAGIDHRIDEDLAAMEQELVALEAWGVFAWSSVDSVLRPPTFITYKN